MIEWRMGRAGFRIEGAITVWSLLGDWISHISPHGVIRSTRTIRGIAEASFSDQYE